MSQVQEDKPPDFQLLSLSGGGFRGLYTAQILALLERQTGQPIGRNFDLIAGTSVGGILALAVALEIPMARIVNLFEKKGSEIFRKRPWWRASFGGLIRSTYTADSLKALLSQPDIFGDLLIADLKHRVLIPSINYTRGAQVVFKTSHHPNFSIDLHHKLVDVALATSAAPTFFPRHSFNSNQ
jgi:patatin-like phospholipase/acyl hydrolase